jgi:hypothetical protein
VPEREASSYAEEGTRAHEIAANVLIAVPVAWESGNKPLPDTSDTDPEMLGNLSPYLDYVSNLYEGNEVLLYDIERQLVSECFEDFGGTLDCLMIYKDADGIVWMHVIDLKYGQGVAVAAERNTQLLCYLMLASEKHPKVKHFRATIVQPRVNTKGAIDTVEVTVAELEEFESRVQHAMTQVHRYAGDHCRWCPWSDPLQCEELYQVAIDACTSEFETPPDSGEAAVEDVWVTRWVRLYGMASVIKGLLDSIPKWMLMAMKEGREVPGYKAVASLGHTKWVDEELTAKKLQRKLGKKTLFESKIKSPAKLRKEGHGDLIDKVGGLTVRPELPPKVVPETDKREAISFTKPEQEFSLTLEDFLEG